MFAGGGDDLIDEFGGRQVGGRADDGFEPSDAEGFAGFIGHFDDAIGEKQKHVFGIDGKSMGGENGALVEAEDGGRFC